MSGNAGKQKASSVKAQIAWAITLMAGILLILVLRFVGLEPELTREPFPGFEGQQTVLVHGLGIHEQCLELRPKQGLDYRFQASHPLSFDIHYHIDGQPLSQFSETSTNFGNQHFKPKENRIYCLMWVNPRDEMLKLSYELQFEIVPGQLQTGIPVRFVSNSEKRLIRILNGSQHELGRVETESDILNFELSRDQQKLAVLVSGVDQGLQLFELPGLEKKNSFSLEKAARMLAFSEDGNFLAVADEHQEELLIIDLSSGKKVKIELPATLLALETGDQTNELLGRTELEVLKLQFDPPQLLERDARIELAFGDQKMMVDPDEVCFAHGIPHPLFTPKAVAMSPEGLPGFLAIP